MQRSRSARSLRRSTCRPPGSQSPARYRGRARIANTSADVVPGSLALGGSLGTNDSAANVDGLDSTDLETWCRFPIPIVTFWIGAHVGHLGTLPGPRAGKWACRMPRHINTWCRDVADREDPPFRNHMDVFLTYASVHMKGKERW